MESASSVGPCPDDGEFVAKLTSHQGMLQAYLNTLLPGDPDVADIADIAQQASIVLWRKRAEFQPGSSFRAWLLRVAYWEARELDDAGPPKVRFYVDGREDPATRANRDAVFPVETRRAFRFPSAAPLRKGTCAGPSTSCLSSKENYRVPRSAN